MAFLKNLQDVASAVTGTLVTSANLTNKAVGALEKGVNAVDSTFEMAEVIADKNLQTTKVKADGELRKELEALWKEFPDLRPTDAPPAPEHSEEKASEEKAA